MTIISMYILPIYAKKVKVSIYVPLISLKRYLACTAILPHLFLKQKTEKWGLCLCSAGRSFLAPPVSYTLHLALGNVEIVSTSKYQQHFCTAVLPLCWLSLFFFFSFCFFCCCCCCCFWLQTQQNLSFCLKQPL